VHAWWPSVSAGFVSLMRRRDWSRLALECSRALAGVTPYVCSMPSRFWTQRNAFVRDASRALRSGALRGLGDAEVPTQEGYGSTFYDPPFYNPSAPEALWRQDPYTVETDDRVPPPALAEDTTTGGPSALTGVAVGAAVFLASYFFESPSAKKAARKRGYSWP
jgi:hypothetical protein